ncbi:acyl-CoA dehydrogenase family protein [Flagellimonas baculiformis]|uniref:acyl-CoA dehydrogenase n=1 Tax=Flagellimonas baculiformis TaxID=3067310 RepID=UPI00296F07CE|nr:acyl-CoA dehydrogenase [Muricauda sp. D6]
MQKLRERCFGQREFPQEVLDWMAQENLWNIWVPKSYGGLEMTLAEGLEKLRSLAQMDGSLGWTVTLCSGANFFIGNLREGASKEIFADPREPVCFGGSGGVFGTAEKLGDGYVVSGVWKYATGAPYLTHFTLNAKILEKGEEVLTAENIPLVRSFVVKREDVEIIQDWNTMGLKATATHSFVIKSKWIHEKFGFVYDESMLPHDIFKVPFAVFADLTLWVNYIGMAAHILEEAKKIASPDVALYRLLALVTKTDHQVMEFAERVQRMIDRGEELPQSLINEIHSEASDTVRSLSGAIISVYPQLGIRAATENHPLNQAFRDYFTATQHHIFSELGRRS